MNSLCDLVLRHAAEPRSVIPAIEWAANEVTDNVELHASAATPGVFFARIDAQRQRLELAVVDQGIGIRQSLASSITTGSDGEAIAKALQRGVTRDPKVGQGNGLAGTREIVVENRGDLHVWSGNAMFRILAGQDKGYVEVPGALGTGVVLNFRLDRPIDLRNTFIAGTALDFIGKQAEAAETAGLMVRDEVVSARARAPAASLRRKIMALLPDLDSPLIIDFAGINGAASSFLDELLGRLAAELGESTFRRRVEIRNMNPLVARTANVVIAQRLHGLPEGSEYQRRGANRPDRPCPTALPSFSLAPRRECAGPDQREPSRTRPVRRKPAQLMRAEIPLHVRQPAHQCQPPPARHRRHLPAIALRCR
ncbi:STAS-like domain-containing protein [Sediminicoccus sp. BL-A-41-H5]|uniref:STAS-like domain-containing protein n=1 Tax=Sediminicoccus sp. BL-A-41-H5 TaxID=3421106 RepID=UPI003D67A7E4